MACAIIIQSSTIHRKRNRERANNIPPIKKKWKMIYKNNFSISNSIPGRHTNRKYFHALAVGTPAPSIGEHSQLGMTTLPASLCLISVTPLSRLADTRATTVISTVIMNSWNRYKDFIVVVESKFHLKCLSVFCFFLLGFCLFVCLFSPFSRPFAIFSLFLRFSVLLSLSDFLYLFFLFLFNKESEREI